MPCVYNLLLKLDLFIYFLLPATVALTLCWPFHMFRPKTRGSETVDELAEGVGTKGEVSV